MLKVTKENGTPATCRAVLFTFIGARPNTLRSNKGELLPIKPAMLGCIEGEVNPGVWFCRVGTAHRESVRVCHGGRCPPYEACSPDATKWNPGRLVAVKSRITLRFIRATFSRYTARRHRMCDTAEQCHKKNPLGYVTNHNIHERRGGAALPTTEVNASVYQGLGFAVAIYDFNCSSLKLDSISGNSSLSSLRVCVCSSSPKALSPE